MRTEKTTNKIYTRILFVPVLILLIPFFGMLIGNDFNWGIFDFIIAYILLVGTGLLYQFAANRTKKTANKVFIGIVVTTVLLIIWAQLAVGIF